MVLFVVGPKWSEGSRLFWLALADRGWTPARCSREIGKEKSAVTRWMKGQRRPEGANRTLLREWFGIPSDSWDLRPTQELSFSARTGTDG